jgi:hypothetical protein
MRPRREADKLPLVAPAMPRRASDRETRAALGSASRQDLATADALHPGAKPVRPRAAQLGWLKGAFHLVAFEGACTSGVGPPAERLPSARWEENAAGLKSLTLERVTLDLSTAPT